MSVVLCDCHLPTDVSVVLRYVCGQHRRPAVRFLYLGAELCVLRLDPALPGQVWRDLLCVLSGCKRRHDGVLDEPVV
jgi:hypothetical protein